MNPFSTLDDSTIIGYFKGGSSTDPDVIHSRYTTYVSGARTMRTFLLIPFTGGILGTLVGVPLAFLVIGIPFLLISFGVLVLAWWARRRIAKNIRHVESVYTAFAATLSR